jgi:hypothetical protein
MYHCKEIIRTVDQHKLCDLYVFVLPTVLWWILSCSQGWYMHRMVISGISSEPVRHISECWQICLISLLLSITTRSDELKLRLSKTYSNRFTIYGPNCNYCSEKKLQRVMIINYQGTCLKQFICISASVTVTWCYGTWRLNWNLATVEHCSRLYSVYSEGQHYRIINPIVSTGSDYTTCELEP